MFGRRLARDDDRDRGGDQRRQHEEMRGAEAVSSASALTTGAASTPLVEVAELIVQPRAQRRILGGGAHGGRTVGLTAGGPAQGHERHATAPVAPTRYGNSHARRLKPLSIGAASGSWLPYCAMKYW